MRNPAIVMIDVFSILAISVFVLYTVSSGRSSQVETPEICIVNVRLAVDNDSTNTMSDLPAYLSQMVSFDVEAELVNSVTRVYINLTATGLEVIIEEPDSTSLRLIVDKILDDRVIGMKVVGEVQVVGGGTQTLEGFIGNWYDPTFFNGCSAI